MDVLRNFEVRKTKAQKQAFRDAVTAYAQSLGYTVKVEQGKRNVNNVIIGDPSAAEFLITAHYDTPARMILPNLLTPYNLLTYLLYQILVVGVLIVAALATGWLVSLEGFPEFAFLCGYVVYFGLLILMMAGRANPHNANDNTSGVVTVLEIARTLDENQRNKVAFVLFDLEELGLVGSSAYRKAHKKETDNQTILNLDCVGDGDHILLLPFKKALKDKQLMTGLDRVCGDFGEKHLLVRSKGFRFYPSDQANFPRGVGIAAFRKIKYVGYYCDKIHTCKDTVLEETNVNILRAALTTLISNDAAE
jgi:hypothetical protein